MEVQTFWQKLQNDAYLYNYLYSAGANIIEPSACHSCSVEQI